MLVRMDPADTQARMLKAASLRKRGYAELNPIARYWYLSGALELERQFDPKMILRLVNKALAEGDQPAEKLFESWRYLVNGEAAGDTHIVLGFEITDTGERLALELRNSILEARAGELPGDAAAVVSVSAADLNRVSRSQATFAEVAAITGDAEAPDRLVGLLDRQLPDIYLHD